MSTEPVSLNPDFGFVWFLPKATTASTPLLAIFPGNCMTVAPMMPFFTFATPVHDPSMDPMVIWSCLPAALIAANPPAAAGSLMV